MFGPIEERLILSSDIWCVGVTVCKLVCEQSTIKALVTYRKKADEHIKKKNQQAALEDKREFQKSIKICDKLFEKIHVNATSKQQLKQFIEKCLVLPFERDYATFADYQVFITELANILNSIK